MATSTKTRMAQSISKSRREIFLRRDLDKFGTPSRVTRGINELVKEGKLVRLGYGIYSRAIPSPLSGNAIPREPLEVLTPEIFRALNIPIAIGKTEADYRAGLTTQVPMKLIVSTGAKRVSRRIAIGNREVAYEKNIQRTD